MLPRRGSEWHVEVADRRRGAGRGTGLLPADQAQAVLLRVWPFLTAITFVAELADAAGLFSVAADRAARLGRGSVPVLFLLMAALATATTAELSLDTTAVLLTPIVLTLTARLGCHPPRSRSSRSGWPTPPVCRCRCRT